MEHKIRLLQSLVITTGCMIMTMSVNTCSVTPATPRMWDNALVNLSESSVLLTLSSETDQLLYAFQESFTVLNTIEQTLFIIASECNDLSTILINSTSAQVQTITSNLDLTQTLLSELDTVLLDVHINDFGGTWTALNALNTAINQNFSTTNSYISIITDQVDALSVQQYTNFVDTVTALHVVSNIVLAQMIALESLSAELIVNLSSIDESILYTNTVLLSANSQIDVFNALLYDFNYVFTMINTLISQTVTIESKLNFAEQVIIESQAEALALLSSIESEVEIIESMLFEISAVSSTIDLTMNTILSSILSDNTQLSLIDLDLSIIDRDFYTLDSKISVGIMIALTLESAIEALDVGLNAEINAVSTIISKVESLNSFMSTTITSKVDALNSTLITIESDIEAVPLSSFNSQLNVLDTSISNVNVLVSTISSAISGLENEGITVTSKVNSVDAAMLTILSQSLTISSKVDYNQSQINVVSKLDTTIQSAISNIGTLITAIEQGALSSISTVATAQSKLTTFDKNSSMLSSLLDTINAGVMTIASEVNLLNTVVITGTAISQALIYDMQTTWTMLNAINHIMLTSLSQQQTTYSQVSTYSPKVDFSGIYTTIAAINKNETSALASALTLSSKVSVYDKSCVTNLGPTFTAIAATTQVTATADSYVDVYATTIQNIINLGGTLVNTIISLTSTYTISTGGRYALSGNINFAPSTGIPCIYVTTNNVNIDMCGQTIQQTNAVSGVTGILVASGVSNVTIQNGEIIGFTNSAIQFTGNNSFITIQDIDLINNNGNQLVINSSLTNQGANNIYMSNVITSGGSGHGVDFNNAAGIFVTNGSMMGASGSGMNINACDYLVAQNCTFNNNQYGISAVTTNQSNQQYGMTDFVLDQCTILSNQIDGLQLSGYNAHGLITNCIILNNTSGMHFEQAANQIYPSSGNCITNNSSSKNLSYGIYVDGATNDNFYAFNDMFSNTMINYKENAGQGPNSVLGNFAFNIISTNNYTHGQTVINTATVQNSQLFSGPEPTYWVNIAMAP